MKKIGLTLLLAALALTGCSSAPAATEETPTPTAEANPNEQACEDFADASLDVGNAVVDGEGKDFDIVGTFDTIALAAEGDVKDRIETLIDELPEPPHMIVWMDNRDAYSEDVESVVRACEAEGFTIQAATLTAGE
jgi:hypothetical protein